VQGDQGGPDPFNVLKNALAYLAKQPQFSMSVSDTYDEVTEDDQKVSFVTNREVYVRRPGKAAVEYRGEGESRQVILDGQKVTLVDRTKNSYGQAPAAPTIDAALDQLATDYGVTVAVGELLRTNLYDRIAPNIQTGQYLGRDTIGTSECDHLGFTTADTDWEAWVQVGDRPILRKLSISYKNLPARPRYTMLISRFDPTSVQDYLFKPDIGAGAQQVSLTALTPSASTKP